MASSMLPASPSWYCSRVIDTNKHGLMCFGAKHSIYLFDTVPDPPAFHGHIPAHQDRVAGLSFQTASDTQMKLCSVSEDLKVKIWDLEDKTVCGEHAEHKHKPTAIHWSPADKNLIVSGDERGVVVVWEPQSGELRSLAPEPCGVFCVTCSPHIRNYVAVGYKSGLILILDLDKKGNPILQRLRGHDDEVHCVVWSPQQGSMGSEVSWRKKHPDDPREDESYSQQEDSDYLLASGSRDKTIRIWSVTKGRCCHTLRLPHNTGPRRMWEDGSSKQRVWVTLYWPPQRPQEIVSSSFNGDLLLWDLLRPNNKAWRLFGGGNVKTHNRIVFNIGPSGNEGRGLCSISMDRQVMLWDGDSLSPTHSIPTLGGFAYCIAQSPIHPGRLAVGVGDSLVRVWNVENPQLPYDASVFWQGIKSKVTALCWHPKREGHLAFGTDDGKVGILDIIGARSRVSTTYHKRTVYVVCWGPPCKLEDGDDSDTDFMLYSCGDGNVLQHDPSALDKNATNVNFLIKKNNKMENRPPGRSDISWKQDFSLVALGNEDGSIEVFKPPMMRLLCSVQINRKLVNCVRWHPDYTAESMEPSRCRFWLASGSNETIIHVVDLKKALEAAESQTSPVVVTESFCQLEGHTNRITGLCWSVHKDGQLVSGSYDWTAQVWDVKKVEPVCNFRAHHGRLLSVLWSSIDPDVIYTGGDDFTAQAWHISQQTHKLPPAGSEKRMLKNRSKKSKFKKEPLTMSRPAVSDPPSYEKTETVRAGPLPDESMAEIQKVLDQKRRELLLKAEDPAAHENGAEEQVLEAASEPEGLHLEPSQSTSSYPTPRPESSLLTKRDCQAKKDPKEKKRKARSLFPLSSTMDNRGKLHTQDDCVTLMNIKSPADGTQSDVVSLAEDQVHLGHFLDRRGTYQLFDKELAHHLNQGSHDQYTILEAFKGNVGQSVNSLVEKQELNDFTVAMSAMASVQTWRETCAAYAKQLEKEGNFQKAASYFLATQQVYEAIDLLKRNGLFKDAVSLARVRLSPRDPVIGSLFSAWGHQLTSDGNFELAAKCFIANDQPLEAARLLARRADLSALRVATEICLHSSNFDNAKVYCSKYTQQCMLGLDWADAASLINKHPSLKLQGLLVTSHQCLLQQLQSLGCQLDLDVSGGDSYGKTHQPGAGGDNKVVLPLLFQEITETKDWLPWKPFTIEGEAYIHYLIRQWHQNWELGLDKESLKNVEEEMSMLSITRQSQTVLKQILMEVSANVALAVVKMLLGHTEDAAYWITVAIATCQENGFEELSCGLCQLLFPAGPELFPKLLHEVRALRLSVLPQDISLQEIGGTAEDTLTTANLNQQGIGNSARQCSFMDSMIAMFYFTALTLVKKTSGTQTKQTSEKICPAVSCSRVKEASRYLLWSEQLRKKQLQDNLHEIRKGTAALISQHSESLPNGSPAKEQETSRPIVYPPTPNIQDVSLPEFHRENQQIISRSETSEITESLRLVIPTVKPHQRILFSPLNSPQNFTLSDSPADVEEFMEMKQHEQTSPVSTLETEAVTGDPTVEENLNAESGQTEKMEVSKVLDEENVYSDLPSEWYSLPMEAKYRESYVTLALLSAEQRKVQDQLDELQCTIKTAPFPDPEASVMLLLELSDLCKGSSDVESLIQELVSWGEKHCYTQKALNFIKMQKLQEQ